MNRNLLMTTAVIALSTAGTFASAQSLSSGDELWTGGFVGLGGSFLDVSAETIFEGMTYGDANWFLGDELYDTEGWTGGEGPALGSGTYGTIEVGADKQNNEFVLGGFASYDFGSVNATASVEDSWYYEGNSEGNYFGPEDGSVTATVSVGNN